MPTTAELVTPEATLFSGEAEFVVLRSDGGEIMFLPNHAPFIGAVDISLVRIAPPGADAPESGTAPGAGAGGGEFRAAVHGGFVHVAGNKVTLLASVGEVGDEIDVERARRALEKARAALGTSEASEGHETPPTGDRPRGSGPSTAGGEAGAEQVELSPTMKAMLYPDDPEVALRRAEVRLEAAGAGGDGAASL
ncbi:MAG: F0F1 ATP synthase subunit epsilon [Acidimicrobiales bacterium]